MDAVIRWTVPGHDRQVVVFAERALSVLRPRCVVDVCGALLEREPDAQLAVVAAVVDEAKGWLRAKFAEDGADGNDIVIGHHGRKTDHSPEVVVVRVIAVACDAVRTEADVEAANDVRVRTGADVGLAANGELLLVNSAGPVLAVGGGIHRVEGTCGANSVAADQQREECDQRDCRQSKQGEVW